MPGMMDYSLNLSLKLALDKSSFHEATANIEKSFDNAFDKGMKNVDKTMAGVMKGIKIDLSLDDDEFKKSLDAAEKSIRSLNEQTKKVEFDRDALIQMNNAARMIGSASRESIMDVTSLNKYLIIAERIEDVLGRFKDDISMNKDQYASLAGQVAWFKQVSENAYRGIINDVMKMNNELKSGAVVDRKRLEDIMKALDVYETMNVSEGDRAATIDRVLKLSTDEKKVLDERLQSLSKMVEKHREMLKSQEALTKIMNAMSLGNLMKLLTPIGLIETALGLAADAFRMISARQEEFHSVNFRLYGSMQELSRGIGMMALQYDYTSEEATRAYRAVMDTAAPKDKLNELALSVAAFNRVTGIAENTTADFHRALLGVTGSTTTANNVMDQLVGQMKASGLTGRDVERVLKTIGDNAELLRRRFGESGVEDFGRQFATALSYAKKYGEDAVKATGDLTERLAKGGMDEQMMMAFGPDIMFESDINKATAMMAQRTQGFLDQWHPEITPNMSKVEKQAAMARQRLGKEIFGDEFIKGSLAYRDMWKDAEKAAKKAGKLGKSELENNKAITEEFNKLSAKKAALEEEKKKADENAKRQWDLALSKLKEIAGALAEPFTLLAQMLSIILLPITAISKGFRFIKSVLDWISPVLGDVVSSMFRMGVAALLFYGIWKKFGGGGPGSLLGGVMARFQLPKPPVPGAPGAPGGAGGINWTGGAAITTGAAAQSAALTTGAAAQSAALTTGAAARSATITTGSALRTAGLALKAAAVTTWSAVKTAAIATGSALRTATHTAAIATGSALKNAATTKLSAATIATAIKGAATDFALKVKTAATFVGNKLRTSSMSGRGTTIMPIPGGGKGGKGAVPGAGGMGWAGKLIGAFAAIGLVSSILSFDLNDLSGSLTNVGMSLTIFLLSYPALAAKLASFALPLLGVAKALGWVGVGLLALKAVAITALAGLFAGVGYAIGWVFDKVQDSLSNIPGIKFFTLSYWARTFGKIWGTVTATGETEALKAARAKTGLTEEQIMLEAKLSNVKLMEAQRGREFAAQEAERLGVTMEQADALAISNKALSDQIAKTRQEAEGGSKATKEKQVAKAIKDEWWPNESKPLKYEAPAPRDKEKDLILAAQMREHLEGVYERERRINADMRGSERATTNALHEQGPTMRGSERAITNEQGLTMAAQVLSAKWDRAEREEAEASPIVANKTHTGSLEPVENKEAKLLEMVCTILTNIDGKVNFDVFREISSILKMREDSRAISLAGLPTEATQYYQAR